MSTVIKVAHDPTCPWCYIGWLQAKKLHHQFGVTFDWLGYELYPESLPWPEPSIPEPEPANRPKTPSRFQLALAAADIDLPKVQKPHQMRVHSMFQAIEFAKEHGKQDEMIDLIYEGYWERGEAIGEIEVLLKYARVLGLEESNMKSAIEEKRYWDKIVPFDDEAYSVGVYNVPTFFLGEERLAEQPYRRLEREFAKFLGK